jgi:magnesium transporter
MTDAAPAEPNGSGTEDTLGLASDVVRSVVEAIDAGDHETALALVRPLHSADVADLLGQIDPAQRKFLIDVLRGIVVPEFLPYLDWDLRDEVIEHLDVEDIAAAVAELETDDAIDLLEDLDEADQREVLDALPPFERLKIEEGLSFPEESAGRLMQRDFVAVPAYWTVGQVIDYMRETDDLPDEFYQVFVVDPTHRPVGTMPLYRVMRTKRPVRVREILDESPVFIPVAMDQEEVAYHFQQYDLASAGVVDESGRLVGVITFDDVADVIHEEVEEDVMRLGGLAEGDLFSPLIETTRRRFLWLFVNLGTAVLASAVIGMFGATIEQIVALAILMPIVASMGGNAATQTMTIAVRALATRDLTVSNALRVVNKESSVGIINGILFATLIGIIAIFWFGSVALGGVIAIAMVINMLAAALAGILIPLAFNRLGIDPAIAATVFVTTVTDVVGFLAFLGLGTLMLL